MQINIKLEKNEYFYLSRSSFLPDRIKSLFSNPINHDDIYTINLSDDQADEIRDICNEQLQIIGFDKNYELTTEGQILDILVDKFFIK